MALAIVPPNRNSGVPCPEFDVPDDFTALVQELMADEQITELEASSQALDLVDDLQVYAASWDTDAYMAGNLDTLPNANIPGSVLNLAPASLRQPVLNE